MLLNKICQMTQLAQGQICQFYKLINCQTFSRRGCPGVFWIRPCVLNSPPEALRHPILKILHLSSFKMSSLTCKILALPYQKYKFSERKFHEEFKYGIKYDMYVGSGTKILWLKIFRFWGPQKWIFARSISHSPFDPIGNSTAYLNSSWTFLSGDI